MSVKTEIVQSYVDNQPKTEQEIRANRAKVKKSGFKLGKAALLSTLALAVGTATMEQAKSKDSDRSISYIVQPGETVDTIVNKLEHKYGQDPYGYDYQGEEYKLSQSHPQLHPGEILSVPIR